MTPTPNSSPSQSSPPQPQSEAQSETPSPANSSSSPTGTVTITLRNIAANALAVWVCMGLMAIVLATFALPWQPSRSAGGAQLQRYLPLHDGDARLRLSYDRDDKPKQWTSESHAILRSVAALANQLPRRTVGAIFSRYHIQGGSSAQVDAALGQVQIIETLQRTLTIDGKTGSLSIISLRDPEGEHLLSIYDTTTNQERVFDPPVLLTSSDLSPGYTWVMTGYLSLGSSGISFTYAITGNVVGSEARITELGQQADCLRIDLEFRLERPQVNAPQAAAHTQDANWYCAELGWVETQSEDLVQQQSTREVLSKSSLLPSPLPARLPSASPAASPPAPAVLDAPDFNQWTLTRLGQLPRGNSGNGDTFALTPVNGTQPMIVAGLYSGDLVAYNAATSLHEVLWRLHLGGPAYGRPAFDETTGRIYIGSSDKHLYAIDQRGLYLWSFATQDNVATTPVISDNLIIFGSEDRRVYALDKESGALRWQFETGGAVVASPVIVGNLVAFGSDDGQVYALDITTGKAVWTVGTGRQVEAALISDGETLFVASRDNNLYAIATSNGQVIWQARSDGLNAFRDPPALGADTLYLLDVKGVLYAIDRQSGQRVWRSNSELYVGRPGVLTANGEEYVLVAQRNGTLEMRSADGRSVQQWQVMDSLLPPTASVQFTFGPLLGKMGSTTVAWMLDNNGVMRLLAPPSAVTRVLRPSFVRSVLEDAFAFSTFDTAALPYQGQALILDSQDRLHSVNPNDGQAKPLGQLDLDKNAAPNNPVIAGDTLLIPRKGVLTAVHLPDAAILWQVSTGNDRGLFSPTVIGDAVYWATSRLINSSMQTGTLQSIELATGNVRWQFDVEGYLAIGNINGDNRNGTIYLSSPTIALNRETGEPMWQALFDNALTLGGGALSQDGQVLYVSALAGNQSSIHAVNTRDGSELWSAPISASVSFQSAILLDDATQTLVVKTNEGDVLGLSAATGKTAWQYQPRNKVAGQITLRQGRIWLIHNDSRVSVLQAVDGKLVATFNDTLSDLSGRTGQWQPSFVGNAVLLPIGDRLIGVGLNSEGQIP